MGHGSSVVCFCVCARAHKMTRGGNSGATIREQLLLYRNALSTLDSDWLATLAPLGSAVSMMMPPAANWYKRACIRNQEMHVVAPAWLRRGEMRALKRARTTRDVDRPVVSNGCKFYATPCALRCVLCDSINGNVKHNHSLLLPSSSEAPRSVTFGAWPLFGTKVGCLGPP